MSNEPAEFLTRNTDPVSCIVGGKVDQSDDWGIEDQLSHPNQPKDGYGESRNVDRREIADSAELLVEDFDDSRAFRGIPMDCLMDCLPDQQRRQLREKRR